VLVGRDPQVAALTISIADRTPTLLVGEAGVGKTELMRAAAVATGVRVFEGGALSTLSWMDYLAIERAVGRVPAGDAPAIAAMIQTTVGDGVLLLDDLHWAAPATIEVVEMLAEHVRIVAAVRQGDPGAGPTTDRLVGAGFTRLEIAPLDPPDAADLVRQLRPDLKPAAVEDLVRRTGGNPLLLCELITTGEPSASLRLMLAARLRTLDVTGREAFGLLALAGRPLPTEVVGRPGVKSLLAVGLGVLDRGQIAVRHALLADIAAEQLDTDERRELHARLAHAVDDPGEAARHHLAAGDIDRARAAALAAADATTRPGERASHLALAAECASGEAADELRLRAARALDEAHDWDAMIRVLDQVASADPSVQGWSALLRARGAWAAGDGAGLRESVTHGLNLVAGTGSEVEVKLRIEKSRVPIFVDCDLAEGIRSAQEAFELAVSTGIDVPRARYLLGTAQGVADQPGAEDNLARAIDDARASGDTTTEFLAANNLISYHESTDSPQRARELAEVMILRADGMGLSYWASSFQATVVNLDFHAGANQRVVDIASELLRLPLEARTRDILVEDIGMALLDLGRVDEAVDIVTAGLNHAAPDHRGQSQLQWVLAECALWGGHPARAFDLVDDYLRPAIDDPNVTFGYVTRAWASVESGRDPGPPLGPQVRPMLLAIPEETLALEHLHHNRYDHAIAHFDLAAPLWAPYHRRGELRCQWAAGEAIRRGGEAVAAIERLEAVEARARDDGAELLLARIHRSLRAAGQRRSAPRSTAEDGLTQRERQVLHLVATGATNAEIATRLGITRRTVVALIASASTKLGATGRNQAASLVTRT
jgi:DNA-binding CsgD family transcriptional regulator